MKIKSFIILFIFLISCTKSTEIELTCSYQAYACGDCYPQFKIDTIIYDIDSNVEIGDNIKIIYKDKELEEWIDSCLICYNFKVKGKIHKKLWKNYYVLCAEDYSITEKFIDCCEENGED